jgi:ABC-2 type transport system permease protein
MAHAAACVVRRDWQLALSYRARFALQILTAFFTLTMFFYISRLVSVDTFASADAYYAYAVVGLIILQVLNSTLVTPPMSLRQELMAGTFERLVVSPFGAVGGLLSSLVFPLAWALLAALAMLAFAGVVFGVDVRWATLPLAVPLGIVGALSFAPFGIALLALVLAIKQAASGATFVVAGIGLIAGLYFPVALLPDWIEWTSEVQPFTPAVELLRHVIVGTPLSDPAWTGLAKLFGFTAVLLVPAVLALRACLRHVRRTGTVIEY